MNTTRYPTTQEGGEEVTVEVYGDRKCETCRAPVSERVEHCSIGDCSLEELAEQFSVSN